MPCPSRYVEDLDDVTEGWMPRAVKHLSLLTAAAALSLAAYHLGANASSREHGPGVGLAERVDAALGRDASFRRLQLMEHALFFVDERYVEPGRVDPEVMFDQALEAVERKVPEVLFRRTRQGRQLHVDIGGYSTAMDVLPVESLDDLHTQLQRVAGLLEEHLSSEVPLPEVEYALINGVLSTLDPHTVLLPPQISKELDVENEGEFGGLGITITIREGWLTVEYPLQDTPAWRAGLKAGDRILRIDDESTINMDLQEAVGRLRGLKGEPVTIAIERDTFDNPRDFTIVRDTIAINEVEGELLEGGVGYVRIKSFHARTAADLGAELAGFKRRNSPRGVNGLILDMRGNPGGYLHQAIEVADKFLSEGVIVSTAERGDKNREEKRAKGNGTEERYPIVVLVDSSSASASEIVAGAPKYQGRAGIVGERTFGKGSVQNLYPNHDDSKLKLTVAKYMTPGDRSIQSIGIGPDIRLSPVYIQMREDSETGREEPFAAVYWSERVDREADLDHHMEWADDVAERPLYTVQYHKALDDEDKPRSDRMDLSQDWQVQFSRDLILSVPSGRRAELLSAAGDVVSRHVQEEGDRIAAAFDSVGVDWSPGPLPPTTDLELTLDLGDDGVVTAGRDHQETVTVSVTNNGTESVHQVMAVSESAFDWIDGEEFYFGHLAPGETRSWPMSVRLVDGYRDQVGQVTFTLRDGARTLLGAETRLVRTVGQPLPAFAWDLVFSDSEGGDGDGIPEQGEIVELVATIENRGPGPTTEAFAKIKNKAGRELDLQVGTHEIEALGSGESVAVSFRFEVRGGGSELPLELSLGDQGRYDYGAVVESGFYSYFSQKDELIVPVGHGSELARREPPTIRLSRKPALLVKDGTAVLSGVVNDDAGVRDVIVFHGDDKVYYQGGGAGIRALPFTVELALEPGANHITVLARDEKGLTDAHSVAVYFDEQGTASFSQADLPNGG